jgi:hypothetical protein
MLAIANINFEKPLAWFKSKGFKVAFIVPTETGLKKSILDATQDFRSILAESKVHDFALQSQGALNKKLVKTTLISKDLIVETQTSLYRPETKKGDPRLWIYNLSKHASAGDLLAILASEETLLIINCSNCDLSRCFEKFNLEFKNLISFSASPYADELLEKITDISRRGYIKSLRSGDTGVGYTFESLLGIEANSSRHPDYKGIEIKSSRSRNSKGTLLSMAPNWSISNLISAHQLLQKRGRSNEKWGGLKTLNHSIRGDKKNNWNLKLMLEEPYIYQIHDKDDSIEKDVSWLLEDFQLRLAKKHRETFWVNVETRNVGGIEEFHYVGVKHTGDIDTQVIPDLIERGVISVDYLIWDKSKDWKKYTKKSGFDFLWKIKNKHKDLLFKFIKDYKLG